MRKLFLLAVIMLLAGAVHAQTFTPMVEVMDQVSVDGSVMIERAVSDGPGFVVIHADNNGRPGEILGFRHINAGENVKFKIPVDFTRATPTLYAMLHYDNSITGEFEFMAGTEGVDGPVINDDGIVVSPFFDVYAISARDRFVDDNMVYIDAVVTPDPGWLVVHADNGEGAPGQILGVTYVEGALNTDVPVELDGETTNTLFPMLHADTGEERTYEFGNVDGADLPVVENGLAAVASFKTVPNVVASQQVVTDVFVADSVLSDGPGWLVIHATAENGGPGPVIGAEFVENGYNQDVAVSLNPDATITPVLFPMLHNDTGEVGTYEFGSVEGADGPVFINDAPLTFPMLTQPSFTAASQPVSESGSINIATVLADSPGWLVIHADNGEGQPGPVIGYTPVLAGLNENVGVLLTGEPTSTVFPMLHADTGELGVYEFGTVDGADGPVRVNGDVVVGPLELQGIE